MPDRKLSPEAREVLLRATVKDNAVVLSARDAKLDRPVYEAVNAVLAAAGGKWKKGKGHVFERNAEAALGGILETGVSVDVRKQFQAFYTPPALAAQCARLARVKGHLVLEPSGGHAAMADACMDEGAVQVDCIDVDAHACQVLRRNPHGYGVEQVDFLEVDPTTRHRYARIVMNPPFSRGQDLKHITHALKFLTADGILVAVCANGSFRDKITTLLCANGKAGRHPVTAGTFKESGTEVAVNIVTLDRS